MAPLGFFLTGLLCGLLIYHVLRERESLHLVSVLLLLLAFVLLLRALGLAGPKGKSRAERERECVEMLQETR